MQRFLRPYTALLLMALASCHRAQSGGSAPMDQRPFAAFITQQIIVTPVARVRSGDTLGWVQSAGGARPVGRQLDSSIAVVLDARGLASRWVLPPALQRTFERNRSYATDPYQLAIEPLRVSAFETGSKVGEPLASQLRTMIALEAEARFVLLPVELRFERDGARLRGALRVVLMDPRTAESRWVGEVKGNPTADLPSALASVATRLADLFVAP